MVRERWHVRWDSPSLPPMETKRMKKRIKSQNGSLTSRENGVHVMTDNGRHIYLAVFGVHTLRKMSMSSGPTIG